MRAAKVSNVPQQILVSDNTAIKALADIYAKAPLDTLKTWRISALPSARSL